MLRQCGAWLKVNAATQSHSPRRCSWPGEPWCESYMLAMARSWGCLLCRGGGEPGSWLTACYELQSTTFSTGAWAAGLGALLLQTDHIQEPSHSHGLMGGRIRGFIPCEEQSTHLPALPQRWGSLSTAGTHAQPAEPCWLLQPLGTMSTSHWSPPGWWETWSTHLRGCACAEKPEACKVKHMFVVWHQPFPATMGEQAPCAFRRPFPLHVASQWQY